MSEQNLTVLVTMQPTQFEFAGEVRYSIECLKVFACINLLTVRLTWLLRRGEVVRLMKMWTGSVIVGAFTILLTLVASSITPEN